MDPDHHSVTILCLYGESGISTCSWDLYRTAVFVTRKKKIQTSTVHHIFILFYLFYFLFHFSFFFFFFSHWLFRPDHISYRVVCYGSNWHDSPLIPLWLRLYISPSLPSESLLFYSHWRSSLSSSLLRSAGILSYFLQFPCILFIILPLLSTPTSTTPSTTSTYYSVLPPPYSLFFFIFPFPSSFFYYIRWLLESVNCDYHYRFRINSTVLPSTPTTTTYTSVIQQPPFEKRDRKKKSTKGGYAEIPLTVNILSFIIIRSFSLPSATTENLANPQITFLCENNPGLVLWQDRSHSFSLF